MPPEPYVPLPVGSVLGAFEITGFVASGGMGSVFRARNKLTGQVRALKVMLPDLAHEPEFLQRFVREIQITASIQHPNVVRVYEPGIDGDRVFLPMELLEGETLGDRLERQRIPTSDALDIVLQVGKAVALFHSQGVLHRDLKPSNIFMAQQPDGSVIPKVLDFGAARPVDRGGGEEATAAGVVIGSPHYMAYEQACGVRDLDGRCDQYALAVILYQMITGVRPFDDDDTGHALAKVLSRQKFRDPRELSPGLSPGLADVLVKAMSHNRDERFMRLDDFLAELEAATCYEPTLASANMTMEDYERLAMATAPRAKVSAPPPPPVSQLASIVGPSTPSGQVIQPSPPKPPSPVFNVLALVTVVLLAGALGWRLFSAGDPAPDAAADTPAASASPSSSAATAAATTSPQPPSTGQAQAPASSAQQAAPTATAAPTSTGARHKHGAPSGPAPCTPLPGAPCL